MTLIRIILLMVIISLTSPLYADYYSAYTNPAIFSCDDCADSWPKGHSVTWVPGYLDPVDGLVAPHWQKVSYADIAFYNQAVECVYSSIHSTGKLPFADNYNEGTYSYSNYKEYEGSTDFDFHTKNLEGIRESGITSVETSLDLRTGDDVSSDLQVN